MWSILEFTCYKYLPDRGRAGNFAQVHLTEYHKTVVKHLSALISAAHAAAWEAILKIHCYRKGKFPNNQR